jgi:hypothetical protein
MRHDINEMNEMIDITLYTEVKPPATVYTGLPDITHLVVLLSIKRPVSEVSKEITKLLAKIALAPVRCINKGSGEPF